MSDGVMPVTRLSTRDEALGCTNRTVSFGKMLNEL
jgi:hypothetical protein